ncbi:MAG: GNAT family N-acetyltransferase [Candidatus Kariarchaeaceae archaeon]
MSEEEITIRHPEISDLEDIVHINRVCLPENYPVAYFIELIKSWKDTSCVVELEGKVVGYILMRIEGASLTPWKPRSETKGHIISVAVLPEVRRKRLGTKMMNFILELADKISELKEITLEVRQSNLAAINLYRRLQFVSDKIISGYYSDGEDAVLMKFRMPGH